MEAWFLADSVLGFNIEEPEKVDNPSEIIEKKYDISCHVRIANRVKNNFSLERAAKNSLSAKRFLEKLSNLAPVFTLSSDVKKEIPENIFNSLQFLCKEEFRSIELFQEKLHQNFGKDLDQYKQTLTEHLIETK